MELLPYELEAGTAAAKALSRARMVNEVRILGADWKLGGCR